MARMTPSEAMVETLVANGVTDCFGIMGSAFMDAMDIFTPAGIRLIPVVHEQGAGHMADGYSRVSGRHGVCIAQNGPGITNFVTAIAAAYWAHSPVVCITPETGTNSQGLGGFQEAQQLPFFETITKYQVTVANNSRMAELTARCFDRAMLENGPTQLNIPRDLFYGDINCEIPEPIRVERSAGGEESLKAAAELLANAEFPVMISGGGVVLGDAWDETIALSEALGLPVVNSYLHNDSFPASHPNWCGPLGYQGSKAGMKLISKADVVLALGTRLGPFGTLPQHGMDYWPKDAKIIQVDINPDRIGLTKKVSVGIIGDAAKVANGILAQLSDTAGDAGREERKANIAHKKSTWAQQLTEMTHEDDDPGTTWNERARAATPDWLSPRMAWRAIQSALPKDAIISSDIGNNCAIGNAYPSFEEGRKYLAPGLFGPCGYGLPAVAGAKIGCPDLPVVGFSGDGAFGIAVTELTAIGRGEWPAVTQVVFRNYQWGAEKRNSTLWFDDNFVGTELDQQVSYAGIANACGLKGVVARTQEELTAALNQAIKDQMENGITTLIEAMINQELGEPFRRDAMKKPVRVAGISADDMQEQQV